MDPFTSENNNLIEIMKLFEGNLEGNDNKISEKAKNELDQKFTNLQKDIFILLKILSLISIDNKEISLNTHINVALYLQSLTYKNKILKDLNKDTIFIVLKEIIKLVSCNNKNNINQNLSNEKIFKSLEILFQTCLISSNFSNDLLDIILNNINSAKCNEFPIIGKYYINFSLLIFREIPRKTIHKIYDMYYKPIMNTIFENIPNYIDEKKNIYNNDFICALKILYNFLFILLSKIKKDKKIKTKELFFSIWKENIKYILQLIQICPTYDEPTAKLYGKENPIIAFNVDENKIIQINLMKYHIFQFLGVVIKELSITKEIEEEKEKYIEEKELIELINKVINLIIIDFKNIINNKNKYNCLKKYKEHEGEIDNNNEIDSILIIFLKKCFKRQPFKSNLSFDIRQIIVNIIFPIMTTIKGEIKFLESNPKEYRKYIKDISSIFKTSYCRSSACFFIYKICKSNSKIKNFILNFAIEMLNYSLNEGKIINNFGIYNIYYKYIKDSYLNQIDNMEKLDLSLLVILILYENNKNSYFNDYLKEILTNNQEKLHLIKDPIIKIKIFKIYDCLFNESVSEEEEETVEKKVNNFNQKAVNYLLDNIIQNGKEFKPALSDEASQTINNILVQLKSESLFKYVCECLEKNCSNFNKMIKIIDLNSLVFIILINLINNIKINERYLIFECIDNLTIRFKEESSTKNLSFHKYYFSFLNSFLTETNKMNCQDKEEVKKFNNIINFISNIVEDLENYELYNKLIEFSTSYIKCLNGINNVNIKILKKIGLIIEKEKKFSPICFNFISTFLSKIKNNIDNNENIDRNIIYNDILDLVNKIFLYKKQYKFSEEENDSDFYPFILSFQILSLNINLNKNNINVLINENLNNFRNSYKKIKAIIIANICLALIYYTDNTLKILCKIDSSKSLIDNFIDILSLNILMAYSKLNFILNKCIIMGIYIFLINTQKIKSINKEKKKKLILVNYLINLMFKQKELKFNIINSLTKKELKSHFVDEENEEEEEEEDNEENNEDEENNDEGEILLKNNENEFQKRIEFAISGNDDIINCDEFKLFSQYIKYIKKYDNEIYEIYFNKFCKGDIQCIKELLSFRNIIIKYKEKEYITTRKIVHIRKSN